MWTGRQDQRFFWSCCLGWWSLQGTTWIFHIWLVAQKGPRGLCVPTGWKETHTHTIHCISLRLVSLVRLVAVRMFEDPLVGQSYQCSFTYYNSSPPKKTTNLQFRTILHDTLVFFFHIITDVTFLVSMDWRENLAGKPHDLQRKNHGFRLRFSQQNQSIDGGLPWIAPIAPAVRLAASQTQATWTKLSRRFVRRLDAELIVDPCSYGDSIVDDNNRWT